MGVEDRLVVRFLTARLADFWRIVRDFKEVVRFVPEPKTVDPEGYKTEVPIFLNRPDAVDDEGPVGIYIHRATQMRNRFMDEIALGTHLSIAGFECNPGDINESR